MRKFWNKTNFLLCLPIVVWTAWAVAVHLSVANGAKVVLPVRGFDPRDILAGRYLAIRADYDAFPSECGRLTDKDPTGAFFCIGDDRVVLDKSRCSGRFITGYCERRKHFRDISVNRFYVSEKSAQLLENAVNGRVKDPRVVVSADKNGRAYPVDLILDGLPYKEWLKTVKK